MYIIVGLGNPGKAYEKTRHNVGRYIVSHLRAQYNFPEWKKDKTKKALISSGTHNGEQILLALPETYMNHSGVSVARVLDGESPQNLIVLHDELDLPVGSFKLSFNRGSAGNKGVSSIIRELKSKSFLRMRIGIAPTSLWGKLKKQTIRGKDFVISPFSKAEETTLLHMEADVQAALSDSMTYGPEKAMNQWNTKRE